VFRQQHIGKNQLSGTDKGQSRLSATEHIVTYSYITVTAIIKADSVAVLICNVMFTFDVEGDLH